MTRGEFVALAAGFSPGDVVVVSGGDVLKVQQLLCDAKASIVGAGKTAVVYDSLYVAHYTKSQLNENDFWSPDTRYYVGNAVVPSAYLTDEVIMDAPFNCSVPPLKYRYKALNIGVSGENEPTWPAALGATVPDRGVTWQCASLNESPLVWELVTLWAQDNFVVLIGNEFQAARQGVLASGVVVDLMEARTIPEKLVTRRFWTRELFPFVKSVFYYDTDTEAVTFIKEQIPERP